MAFTVRLFDTRNWLEIYFGTHWFGGLGVALLVGLPVWWKPILGKDTTLDGTRLFRVGWLVFVLVLAMDPKEAG
jgi:hypothetical protein